MNATTPTLSVIIASVNGPPMIEECLASLEAQRGDVDAEVIVVDVTGEQTVRLIERKFPRVKVVSIQERRPIPQLRAVGLARSNGEIVAIIEDHCLADARWYQEIVKAHRAQLACIAVGGAVENGSCDRLVDWAVFFCEYSHFMQPLPRGIVDDIPGNNASYKRVALQSVDGLKELLNSGFWETTLHKKLRARGEQFYLEPSITVFHKKRFTVPYFLSQRYLYSRYYAGTLVASASLPYRTFRGIAALALPPLLMARIAARVLRKRRHLKELLLTSPLLAIFTGAWAIGEVVGALLGPGQSGCEVE